MTEALRVRLSPATIVDFKAPQVLADGLRWLVVGESGSGKSSCVASIAAQVVAGNEQVVLLDPHGEYSSLWSANPAHVVRIGYGGDPVTLEDVPQLLEMIDAGDSLLVDLRHWLLHTQEMDAFVLEFVRKLFELRMRKPQFTLLVVEEAQKFCMPLDTEILTPSGWRARGSVAAGDAVVAYDLVTQAFRNEPITAVHDRHYTGEMVHFSTKRLDYLVTPDHRVVARRLQRASPHRYFKYPPAFIQADRVPSNVYIPCGGAPAGAGVPDLSTEDARILGWILTDGCRHSKETAAIVIDQSLNTKKGGVLLAEEMRRVLEPRGVAVRKRAPRSASNKKTGPSYSFYFGTELSKRFLRWFDCPNQLHRIPRALLRDGDLDQLRALYAGMLEGDGTQLYGRWHCLYPGKNYALASDFQELCTRLGISSTIKYVPQNQQFKVYVRTKNNVDHCVSKSRRVPFTGPVWDITVPSGAFVARRNGTVFVTGNCPQAQVQGQNVNVLTWVELLTAGRKFGLGVVLASQRISLVDSNVVSNCNARVFMRMSEVKDYKRARQYIPAEMNITYDALRHFRSGEALVLTRWLPECRVRLLQPPIELRKASL